MITDNTTALTTDTSQTGYWQLLSNSAVTSITMDVYCTGGTNAVDYNNDKNKFRFFQPFNIAVQQSRYELAVDCQNTRKKGFSGPKHFRMLKNIPRTPD